MTLRVRLDTRSSAAIARPVGSKAHCASEFLKKEGLPPGLVEEMDGLTDETPMRFWIIDNSDSMRKKDGQHLEVAEDGSIAKIVLRGGEEVIADEYVSALPVDVLKRVVPEAWSTLPYFRQLDELEGILQTPGKMGWIARWLEVCPRQRRPLRHSFPMRSLFFEFFR